MKEDEDFGFIEKIRFPDGVYCKAEAYAHTFDRNIDTVRKLASEGNLKRRKIKGEWYIRMYHK